MSFYVTLPSNASTDHYNNTQSNYTTELDTPLLFSVPYEVALVEFAFREYIIIEIGEISIDFGFGQYIPFSLYGYENEPSDHFVSRINYEIHDYYIIHKLHQNTSLKKINLDNTKNNTIQIKQWWQDWNKQDSLKSNELYEATRVEHVNNIPTISILSNSTISLVTTHPIKFRMKFISWGDCACFAIIFSKSITNN